MAIWLSLIQDKEKGFDAGADDYLTKPYHLCELAARIRWLMAKGGEKISSDAVLKVRDIELDGSTRCVRKAGSEISLSPKAIELL